jgi:mycofactocin system creatininase family protein
MTNLSGARWPELGSVDVVLVPLGSTEQHGPHLPFDTDTVIARAVADAVPAHLAASGVGVVVAPAVPVGSSGEHQDFAGTISIGNDVLRAVVLEVARSVKTWSPRIVFVNGHGGNVPVLNEVVGQLIREEHDAMWVPCGVPGQDAHAGREETSLLLHLAPTSVREELAKAGATDDLATLMPRLRAGGVKAVSANGVLGDPAGANATEGHALLAQMVASVVSRIGTQWPELTHGTAD